jgi:hypothetical protein
MQTWKRDGRVACVCNMLIVFGRYRFRLLVRHMFILLGRLIQTLSGVQRLRVVVRLDRLLVSRRLESR